MRIVDILPILCKNVWIMSDTIAAQNHDEPRPRRSVGKRGPSGLKALRARTPELNGDPEHAFKVCELAVALFRDTKALHKLNERARRLLEAGALLHDIGLRMGVDRHHKHSRDMILELDLPGFTKPDRRIIACLARYHRKGFPKPQHSIFCDLPAASRRIVERLASLLRIADGLDRAHLGACKSLKAESAGAMLTIRIAQDPVNETDRQGGMRKRDLFEALFGMKVEIVSQAAPEHGQDNDPGAS